MKRHLILVLAMLLFLALPHLAQAAQPLLLISYETDPEHIAPGDEFTLTITVKNEGSVAKNILVGLGLASGIPQTPGETTSTGGQVPQGGPGLPISALGSSNVKFLGELAAERSRDIEFKLVASGSARSGTYNLPVRLDYEDSAGVQRLSTQTIGLLILRKPDIKVVRVRFPDEVVAGRSFKISFQVVNAGNFPVTGVTAELLSENLDIEDGEAFMGTLEEGDSDTLRARATASGVGDKKAKIRVSYRDDFNRERTIERSVGITVGKAVGSPQAPKVTGLWQRIVAFFRSLLGFGGKKG